MKRRCYEPSNKFYKNYGGRGIFVCDRWRDSFENFYQDMGDPPGPSYTLDRIDNSLGYSPENCRWATRKQQCRNTRSNRLLTWNGETKTVVEWAEDERVAGLGISNHKIAARLRLGWDIEKAMTTPPTPGKLLTFQGQTLTMMDWSRRLGATANVVSKRLRKGWSLEQALTTPLRQY